MSLGDFGLRLLDTVGEDSEEEEVFANMGDKDAQRMDENMISVADCKCETVVVYLDRAEVSRSLKTRVKEGENEVVITELSSCIDKDSIR